MACHSNSTHFLQRLILAGSLLFVSALTQAADDAIERERLAALLCEDKRMTDDNLVTFLPHRLNRQPVVVRGLTADELWICTGISAVAGLLVGLPLVWLSNSIAMLPTSMITPQVAHNPVRQTRP